MEHNGINPWSVAGNLNDFLYFCCPECPAKDRSMKEFVTHALKQHPNAKNFLKSIGKKHALKKYDQFPLNTSCFWGSTGSNITPVVQLHEIFVTKLIDHYC